MNAVSAGCVNRQLFVNKFAIISFIWWQYVIFLTCSVANKQPEISI